MSQPKESKSEHGHQGCCDDKARAVTKEDLHIHDLLREILMKVTELKPILDSANADIASLRTDVGGVATNLDKVAVEVQTLIDANGSGDLPEEVATAITNLQGLLPGLKTDVAGVAAKAKAIDDKVPDSAAVTP